LFVYEEDEEDLAARVNLSVEELMDLKQRVDARLEKIKGLAKEQGILAPADQRDALISEFIKRKGCSEDFAKEAYKKFIGDE